MTEALIALVALSLMEIVLGIDNIVFISILTSKLPIHRQSAGRRLGLLLALATRILLLSCIYWLAQLTSPVFNLSDWLPTESLRSQFIEYESDGNPHGLSLESESGEEPDKGTFNQHAWDEFDGVSWRDLILIAGGLFLIFNSVKEIHHEVEGQSEGHSTAVKQVSFVGVLSQIALMDIVFSLDSVITAVGMADQLWVMITAVVLAVAVMILFANQVGDFVDKNPTIRMLALNFLLLIGVMLVAEGVGTPIAKGYIYFAMAFSLMVEFLNSKIRKKQSQRV
jgi:predicted tellurium resistance membrane protein TerC